MADTHQAEHIGFFVLRVFGPARFFKTFREARDWAAELLTAHEVCLIVAAHRPEPSLN